jgi:hypothetical protein
MKQLNQQVVWRKGVHFAGAAGEMGCREGK